nr:sulfite efflux pump ssu1 [Quercus suber]
MTRHSQSIGSMTAAWLLPVVSTIVAAATGGLVAEIIPHPQLALITLLTSYVLWGTGVPLAMVILVIYFLRLTTQNLPPKAVIVSSFLPLGPLGQGSFAIMQLGKVAMQVFPATHTVPSASNAGEMLYVVGLFIAIIMWAFGLVWLCFAVASIVRSKGFPFNMGWWGFTFPLGVYAVSTTTLAKEIPSAFFRVLGTIFSVAVSLLWIIVALWTLERAWSGAIFVAPCLKDVEENEAKIREADGTDMALESRQ